MKSLCMILHAKINILIYSSLPCMLNAINNEKQKMKNNAWKNTDARDSRMRKKKTECPV